MAVRKRGSKYQVSVTVEGKRERRSVGTLAEARALEVDLKYHLKDGSYSPASPEAQEEDNEATLNHIRDIVYKTRWRGSKGEKTAMTNSRESLRFFGTDTLIHTITQRNVDQYIEYLEDLGNSDSTINRKTSALRVLFKEAMDRGYIHKIPKLRHKKEGAHRIRWLTYKEEEAALKLFQTTLGVPHMAELFIVAIDTGFRRSELLNLEFRDYENGKLHIWENKADFPRSVPVTERVKAIIEKRRRGAGKIFYDLDVASIRCFWNHMRQLMGMLEDPQFVFHALRHTCCSRLIQNGVPLAVAQEWMGHKNITTTMRYAHLAPENLNIGKEALEARSNSVS